MENALSHPPHRQAFHHVGGYQERCAPNDDRGLATDARPAKLGQLDPLRGGDLRVEPDGGAALNAEHVGANRDGRQGWRPGRDIVEDAETLGPGEVDPYFLGRFADRGVHQAGVPVGPAAARKTNLAGPGVVRPLGPADEEDGVGIRGENQRHCRPASLRVPSLDRRAPGKALGDTGEGRRERVGQWLCEWQDPPQQPPAGGPSLLKSAGFPAVAGRAGTDIRRSTFRSLHRGQATVVPFRTRRSKSEPQDGQW